jgi:hypothetical protein
MYYFYLLHATDYVGSRSHARRIDGARLHPKIAIIKLEIIGAVLTIVCHTMSYLIPNNTGIIINYDLLTSNGNTRWVGLGV